MEYAESASVLAEKSKLIDDFCEKIKDCEDNNCPIIEECKACKGNFADDEKLADQALEKIRSLAPDMVNHPPHYTAGGIECIDALRAACTGLNGFEGYCTAAAIKYLWRWKKKDNRIQDLEKAKWYIDKLIEEEKKHGTTAI